MVKLDLSEKIPLLILGGEYWENIFSELRLCAVAQGIVDLNYYCGDNSDCGNDSTYRKVLNVIEERFTNE